MKHDPFDFSGTSGAEPSGHELRQAERLRSDEYSPEFLKDLKELRAVYIAPAHWDGNKSELPPEVSWVLYPNGELQRIRFSGGPAYAGLHNRG